MFHMNVPKYFWGNAILTSYLINRMPTRVLSHEIALHNLQLLFQTHVSPLI